MGQHLYSLLNVKVFILSCNVIVSWGNVSVCTISNEILETLANEHLLTAKAVPLLFLAGSVHYSFD